MKPSETKSVFCKSSFLILLAAACSIAASGCIQVQQAQECLKTSKQNRYAFYADGVLLASFSEYSIHNDVIVFKEGITSTSFLRDWKEFNRSKPAVMEMHDLMLVEIKKDQTLGKALIQINGSLIRDFVDRPSIDIPHCSIIDRLVVKAEEVREPDGTMTYSRLKHVRSLPRK